MHIAWATKVYRLPAIAGRWRIYCRLWPEKGSESKMKKTARCRLRHASQRTSSHEGLTHC